MRPAGKVLALLAALAVGGCSAPGPRQDGTPSARASGPSVRAAVDQFRDGYATGTIVLQLTDAGAAGFTVVRATLVDPRFDGATVWTGSTVFAPGQTTSLPAVAARPRCSDAAASSAHDAGPSVRVLLADGTEHLVPAEDPHGVLARIHADGCFAATVASAGSLAFDDTLTPGAQPGVAVLTLRVGAPDGGGPSVRLVLESVAGTTLLDEDPGRPWPRGVVLAPGTAVTLAVRPARCDPHAVAEDKVGTLVPLTLAADGQTGVVKVAAPPALRAAIYAFVAAACGWPAG